MRQLKRTELRRRASMDTELYKQRRREQLRGEPSTTTVLEENNFFLFAIKSCSK